MSDLLKEAIADAKAVRETALQNAKMALEEAFTPQLQSMLSAKLREEEDELEDEVPVDDVPMEDDELEDEVPMEDDEMGDEDELDLEAIIRELESELSEEDEIAENEEEVTEQSDELKEEDEEDEEDEEVEESFEVDETLFKEEDEEDEDDVEESVSEDQNKMAEELKEYKEAVRFLKDKLHEVNLLNAKLLFTNKIFKEFALTNNQKMKVVETFDRTQTTREIKLVYSTLAESFGDNKGVTRRVKIKESASAKSGSTKPSRKVITEENQVADRFKKLAGLIK